MLLRKNLQRGQKQVLKYLKKIWTKRILAPQLILQSFPSLSSSGVRILHVSRPKIPLASQPVVPASYAAVQVTHQLRQSCTTVFTEIKFSSSEDCLRCLLPCLQLLPTSLIIPRKFHQLLRMFFQQLLGLLNLACFLFLHH